MSGFRSFALAGAGGLGGVILKELVERDAAVIVLSRSGSERSAIAVPDGVNVIAVDYGDIAGLAKVLLTHHVDVVISAVGNNANALAYTQINLANAAKQSGVKLFVPSEFGTSTVGFTDGLFGVKAAFIDHLEKIDLPYIRIFNGYFTQYLLSLVGFGVNGKFNIIGRGKTPISTTAIEDIAGFVGHVVTTHPIHVLRNKIMRLEGDRFTLVDWASRQKAEIVYVDSVPGPDSTFETWLQKEFEKGAGSTGWDPVTGRELEGVEAAGSGNRFWSGHQWKTLDDIHPPSTKV